jgi:RNA polymerase sigma-70 factor (ECF subfamily)
LTTIAAIPFAIDAGGKTMSGQLGVCPDSTCDSDVHVDGISAAESVQDMLDRWREGDEAAATDIYHRYEQRLLHLAEDRIGPRWRSRIDPDDIMLSVLDTVLRRVANGQYCVDPSGSIWNLLQVIANNKIRKQAEFHSAGKRDVAAEAGIGVDRLPPEAVPHEPTPEEAAVLADELDKIRRNLKPSDFEIFELQLQGYSHPEIARKLGCARQTVRYKAKRIERLLRQWAEDTSG